MSGWVAIDYWDGCDGTKKVVLRVDSIVSVAIESHPYGHCDFLVAVCSVRGSYLAPPKPGESEGDALARVCGLLGIEVSR